MTEKYNLFIDGRWQDGKTGDFIDVVSPIDGEIVGSVTAAGQADVDYAVLVAKESLETWSKTPYEKRLDLAQKFIDYLRDHKDQIAETITKELGCPLTFSKEVQIEFYLKELEDLLESAKDYKFVENHKGYDLHKNPVGVVACITPWNYPLGQITKKIIPALMMGNVVILKPSSQTPITAIWVARAIEAAGYPKGTFALLTGSGSEMGDLLSNHEGINMVTFTGSTQVGKDVASKAVANMKRIAMELGGKSASIILEGADLNLALDKTLSTVYMNSGQTCSAFTRLLVPRSMKEEIEQMVIEKSKAYKAGNPLEDKTKMGPIQSKDQLEKVQKYIKLGQDQGAIVLLGEYPEDMYINPFVFTDVTNDMTIAREEIFGPVLSIIAYDDIDQAVEIANDSKYGLSGGVYGHDEEAYRLAEKIKTGNVFVNTSDKKLNVPFGGFKYSGIGRENGIVGLEEFIELKALVI